MSETREAICAMLAECFDADQRAINYMSYQRNAADAAAAIHAGEDEAKQWVSTTCRIARDIVLRQAESGRPPLRNAGVHALPLDFLLRVVTEMKADQPLFIDPQGKAWTAGSFCKSAERNPTLAAAYSDALCAAILDLFRATAKTAPTLRTQRPR